MRKKDIPNSILYRLCIFDEPSSVFLHTGVKYFDIEASKYSADTYDLC